MGGAVLGRVGWGGGVRLFIHEETKKGQVCHTTHEQHTSQRQVCVCSPVEVVVAAGLPEAEVGDVRRVQQLVARVHVRVLPEVLSVFGFLFFVFRVSE